MISVLVVEDDAPIAMGLEYSLLQNAFTPVVCPNVSSALQKLAQQRFDLVLLDITLPDGSGYDICRAIRSGKGIGENSSALPIIFLTACEEECNVVLGLDLGADDYITKPFRVRELISRLKSVLRRSQPAAETLLRVRDVTLDLARGKVFKEEREIFLTALEYKLFLTLLQNRGRVLSRSQLLEGIWDIAGDFVNDNTLSVYIKRLREKLEDDPQNPLIVQTVRGMGYRVD